MPRSRNPLPWGNPYELLQVYGASESTEPKLPIELLDEILGHLAGSMNNTRERKNLFMSLVCISRTFSGLKATKQALFSELHIFTSPASLQKLDIITNDLSLSRTVRKLTFHRSTLGFHEAEWREYLDGGIPSWVEKRERRPYRQSRKAYILAYLDEKLGISYGIFERAWTNAMRHLPNVTTIEITGNPHQDQFMTALDKPRQYTMVEYIDHHGNSCCSAGSDELMKRLYPSFWAPYATDRQMHRINRDEENEANCEKFMAMVLRAVSTSQVPVKHLRAATCMGFRDTFDWTPFAHSLRHLEVAEIGLLNGLYYEDGGHSENMVTTLSRSAPKLNRIRIIDACSRLEYFPDILQAYEIRDDPDSEGSLCHLEFIDVAIQPDLVMDLLSKYPSLQYLKLSGQFWRARPRGLEHMLFAMKDHDGLQDMDVYFMSRYLHFATQTQDCQFGDQKPCRGCRDMNKVKHDILHGTFPSGYQAPGSTYRVAEDTNLEDLWKFDLRQIHNRISSEFQTVMWTLDDDLDAEEKERRRMA